MAGIALTDPKLFSIDGHLLGGPADAQLTLQGPDDDATVLAIVTNTPFPQGQLSLGSIKLSASTGSAIPFMAAGARDSVSFTANADGFFEAGIYPDPADLLKDLSPEKDIASGVALEAEAGARFLMLRCGYDAGVTAKGAMALGVGATANFGGSVSRNAAYAVIHQFQDTAGARDTLAATIGSWILPSQFDGADRFQPFTWVVTEVDGSVAINLGVQAGYDFSWLRQFPSGVLKGDLGLKVQLAANAALGFSANGSFALALSRETEAPVFRLRLFKLAKNGWNFAFNASAGEQVTLPDIFQGTNDITDLISAVFGVHIAQLATDLNDPGITSAGSVANFIETRGMKEFQDLTGVSPDELFAKGKPKVDEFVADWNALTHKSATMLAAILKKNQDVDKFTAFLQDINGLNPAEAEAGVKSLIATAVGSADFFQTPAGQWIDSVAPTTALAAVLSDTDWKTVQDLSGKALALVNGQTLQSLIDFASQKLSLDVIQKVQSDADAFNLDAWLQAKIANFLGGDPTKKLTLADVQKAQAALKALLANADKFYALARKAAQKKYEIAFTAGYRESTASTALLDASFDLGAHPSLLATLKQAIGGDMQQLLLQQIPGVTLSAATLTHAINRRSHTDLTMPFIDMSSQDVSDVLAGVSPVDDGNGRVLVYNVNATDDAKNHAGFFRASSESDSKLSLVASLPAGSGVTQFSPPSVSYGYTLTKAANAMGAKELLNDLAPLVNEYMPGLFDGGKPPFSAWVDAVGKFIDPAQSGILGETLLSFDVTLPPNAFDGWFQAPVNNTDPRYFAVSLAMQKRLRQMIPFYYFKDPAIYDAGLVADAILAYGALSPSNGFDPAGGKVGKAKNQIYFDLDGSLDALVALMNTADFDNALLSSMQNAGALLRAVPKLQDVASSYDFNPDNVQRIAGNALKKATDDSAALPGILGPLLLFEFNLIQSIVGAAVQIAKFRADAGTNPANAITELASFGDKFVQTFNNHLGSNLVEAAQMRPLGSALILEAGRALGQNGAAVSNAAALLRLSVFDATPPISLDDLLAGNFDSSKIILRETLVSQSV